jgi:hypothetical protein
MPEQGRILPAMSGAVTPVAARSNDHDARGVAAGTAAPLVAGTAAGDYAHHRISASAAATVTVDPAPAITFGFCCHGFVSPFSTGID